jgi:hypothetical protein
MRELTRTFDVSSAVYNLIPLTSGTVFAIFGRLLYKVACEVAVVPGIAVGFRKGLVWVQLVHYNGLQLLNLKRERAVWHPLDWGVSRKRPNLEERLKALMRELGNAINESLSDSERIAEAIGEIKRAGYDVFLVLEATIGFNKREENEDGEELVDENRTGHSFEAKSFEATGKIKLTTQDQKFLRALKIAVDEEAS